MMVSLVSPDQASAWGTPYRPNLTSASEIAGT
jgi:hypothetical protein